MSSLLDQTDGSDVLHALQLVIPWEEEQLPVPPHTLPDKSDVKIDDDGRTCVRCREYKLWAEFPKDVTRPTNHRSVCKKCFASDQRHSLVKGRYGLSRTDYEQMMQSQKHSCKLCNNKFSPVVQACVDHDHVTGKVRGILCHDCNKGLGYLERFARLDVFRGIKSYLKDTKL